MIDKKILVLMETDQSNSSLAGNRGISLGCKCDMYSMLIPSIKNVFSDVISFDFLEYYVNYGATKTSNKLRELILENKPDFLLWLSYAYEIDPDDFIFARQNGVKTIGWFFDDESNFDNYSLMWVPYLDFVLTNDPGAIDKYAKYGITAFLEFFVPSASLFKKVEREKTIDVSFIGSNIADREEYVNYLKDNGINIIAYGSGWNTKYIATSEMIDVYNSSKINICFTKTLDLKFSQYKGKIFEICMCGGVLMVEYFNGLEKIFENEIDAIFFNNKADLLDKVNKYLPLHEKRQIIANNGWEKINNNYSMEKQLSRIFNDILTNSKKYEEIKSKSTINTLKKSNQWLIASNYHFYFGIAYIRNKNYPLSADEFGTSLKYNRKNFKSYVLFKVTSIVVKSPKIQRVINKFIDISQSVDTPQKRHL